MRKYATVILILLPWLAFGQSNHSPLICMPMLQQPALYFSSDHVTAAGFGAGAGVHCIFQQRWVVQVDINLLWGNGNAVPLRLALGWHKQTAHTWRPACFGTFALLTGDRTEVIFDDGQRPVSPTPVAGIRLAPLRFVHPKGFASAMELGYGRSASRGTCLELTVLAIGFHL